jgi:hypothetical protein
MDYAEKMGFKLLGIKIEQFLGSTTFKPVDTKAAESHLPAATPGGCDNFVDYPQRVKSAGIADVWQ